MVIWGVPRDVPEQAVRRVVDKNEYALRTEWKGTGNERHIRLVFQSSLARDALFDEAKKACKRYRWRAAVSRTWRRREQHRATKQGASEPQTHMSNPFAALEEVSMEEVSMEEASEEEDKVKKKGKSQAVKASRELINHRIKAGTFNLAKGLQNKVGELETFLAKKKLDVVALQECGKAPVVVKGFKAFCHPMGEVAILVALRLVAFVAEVKSETAGQLWVRIAGSAGRKDIYVCSAYMLQESEKKETREIAFGALEEAALRLSTKGEVLLMGDLNARVGAPTNQLERSLIGRFGENGNRSDNGRLVFDMMKQVGLVNQGPNALTARCGGGGWLLVHKIRPTKEGSTRDRLHSHYRWTEATGISLQGRLHASRFRSPHPLDRSLLPKRDPEEKEERSENMLPDGEIHPEVV